MVRKIIGELFDSKAQKSKKIFLQICDNIEVIQEYVLLGEEEEIYFDAFLEYDIITRLYALLQLHGTQKEIVQKIISSIASFITNIVKPTHLNYILSHSILNSFIEFTYDFSDEEIVDYYITFLKSLSLRLNNQYMNLYFNQKYSYFPLLWQASKFYNHKSSIITTTVRYIILQLAKIDNPFLKSELGKLDVYKKFLTSFPYSTIYVNYVLHLKQLCLQLDQMMQEIESKKRKYQDLFDQMEKINDLMFFFNDLYQECPFLQKILDNALLEYVVIPAIYHGIFQRRQDVKKIKKKNQETLSISLGLFIIIQLIKYLESPLRNILIYQLFSPNWKEMYTKSTLTQPAWYTSTWKPKSFWDDNMEVVIQYTKELFPIEIEEQQTDLLNIRFGKQIITKTTGGIDPFSVLRLKGNYIQHDIDTMIGFLGLDGTSTTTEKVEQEIQKFNNIDLAQHENNILNLDFPIEGLNGWQGSKNQLRESLEMFIMSKDESLLFSTMSLIDLVYNSKDNQALNSCQINNDDFRQKIIIHLINNLSSENTFKLRTINLAIKIILKFTQDQDRVEHIFPKLKQLQLKAVQRFLKVLQRQVTWEYIFLQFFQELDEKINLQQLTTGIQSDIRLQDILSLNIGIEPLDRRLPFNHQEEVLYEINFYLLMTKLSYILKITKQLPQRVSSDFQINHCYNLKPAPQLIYCELISPYVEHHGDLYEQYLYHIPSDILWLEKINLMLLNAKICRKIGLKLQLWNNIVIQKINQQRRTQFQKQKYKLIIKNLQTNKLITYTFKLHSDEKCIETIASIKDKRNFRQQIEITALCSYLDQQEKLLQI